MQKMWYSIKSLAHGAGASLFLFSQWVKSDELFLQPWTSLWQLPASSVSILQNSIATQIVSDITPDSSFVGPDGIRWILVKTDSWLSLSVPESYNGQMMHFGDQPKFFTRFHLETHLPEVSSDVVHWQPHTSGTPLYVSRQEQGTFVDITPTLQTLDTTSEEQQALADTLVQQQNELAQVQAEVDVLRADLDQSSQTLTTTTTTVTSKEQTRSALETMLQPEARLRSDTHPIVQDTALDDATKKSLTETALNTYDHPIATAPSSWIQYWPTPQPIFTPPTADEVQSTITLLTQELNRIQTQITTVTSQIVAKQNEINTTENSITEIQQTIDTLNAQINEYTSTYYYWNDEWERLDALVDDIIADLGVARQGFDNAVYTLINEWWRSDVPDYVDDPNIAAQVDALKSRISTESVNIANTIPANLWGTDTTTTGKSTYPSTTYVRVGWEYNYKVYFSTTGGYPATIKMYLKPVGGSYSLIPKTYTAYNYTHRMAIINQTVLPFCNKSCDYALADRKLETYQEQYAQLEIDRDNRQDERYYADEQRDAALLDLNDANTLALQRNIEKNNLVAQKATLTQQKADLETLKNIKAQLQTLYNRVKTILDQLQQHVASHSAITTEIADLVNQAQQLEAEISQLETSLFFAEWDEEILANTVATTSDNLAIVSNSLTQTEQSLLALIQDNQNIRPQDSITRSGNTLIPASEAYKYFTYGYRTSQYRENIAGLPAKWIVQYANTANVQEIYPASASLEYTIHGRVYRTDGVQMNNFAHKELINGYLRQAITQLNNSIAVLGSYPSGSTAGIENMLVAIKSQIATLQPTSSSNVVIRDHVDAINALKTKILLQWGTNALFENLVANNAAFSLKIEQITALMAQKGSIADGTDALNDVCHMVTTIFARAFAERLTFSGTDGLDLYGHWEQEALSFMSGLWDDSILTNELDMNADWNIDVHGNKYKFWLYHPAGLGIYNPPATLFMMYSPDGVNTQVLWPVSVSSGAEADVMKAWWQRELLKMKRSHADYSGGAYDIFRGWDEAGGEIWWGQSSKNGIQKSTTFSGNMKMVEWSTKALLESTNISSNLSSNEAFYRSLFGLSYDYFAQNAQATLSSLIQLSDQNLSLALGQILDYSLNVSLWNNPQKEVAKVIISLSWISGFPADQVKEFQRRAIQQLDTLWANYEQDIIYDTLNTGRLGNIEELRTVVVLQKLSQLFMKKKLEMNAINNPLKLSAAEKTASDLYALPITGFYSGMKRLYFATEEGSGESNVKRNIDFIRLCSGDTTLNPGGYVEFLSKRIDLSDMWNIPLWYNAKELWLTFEETVFGGFVAQSGIDIWNGLWQLYKDFKWNTTVSKFSILIEQFENTSTQITIWEDHDRIYYEKWYYLIAPSPINILKL